MPAAVLLAIVLQTATPPSAAGGVAAPQPTSTTRATAVRAAVPVVIDGRDDDAVWRIAQPITQFREFQPKEDGDPRFPTEARVAYDDRYFYVFIRAFDPHPDSILKLLARRDVRAATDQLKIMVDSYHDRRSGFEFAVNPAGVKRDYAMFNDAQEDDAWDAVWDVGTQVDSLGWTAEFRIPLSQLRYVPRAVNTFGFAVWRDIQRYSERVSWPVYRNSQAGISSQLGELTGLEGLPSPRRPEIAPYVVTKNVSVPTGTGEGLSYSRRIGRAPQLDYGDPNPPTATTIDGAAKLTGRLPGGQTLGVLDAVTGREVGSLDRTMEPTTNYAAVRAQQDFRNGESGIGAMGTAVNRDLDQWTEGLLHGSAYVGAVDFRHRFFGRRYQISGSLDLSRVAGTPSAIAATQQDPVHYYQRPGAGVSYDSTRTSLAGDAEELKFGKVGGGITRFETSYQRRSQGFEVNDLGFLLHADQQSWNTWFAFQSRHPSSFYQTAFWNFNWKQYWTAAGTPVERAANTNVHVQLNNRWWLHAGTWAGQLGTNYCDRDCTRGGPAVRVDPYLSANAEVDGDERPAFTPYAWFEYFRGDGGRSDSFYGNLKIAFRVASQVNTSLTLSAAHIVQDAKPPDPHPNVITDSTGTHYIFAYLNRKELSLTARVDYTISTTLTLQLYAQPFVGKGSYSHVRELADRGAADYDARYQPYADTAVTNHIGGVNFKQFRSNVVLRWEYRPGSTLFVVWTQGRQDFAGAEGPGSMRDNFRHLFDLHPDNTFLVKASYWINW